MKYKSSRYFALSLLMKVEDGGYSNIVLGKSIDKSDLTEADKSFAVRLFYGVVERKITLDYIISKHIKKKPDLIIKNILRLGVFQILYMDSIPDYTAVDESVKLCYSSKKVSAKGFVNAILRNVIRKEKNITFDNIENIAERLSVKYSCNIDIVADIINSIGETECEALLRHSLDKPKQYIRVNNCKISAKEFEEVARQDGLEIDYSGIENCYSVKSFDIAVDKTQSFKNGLFHVQDLSSQLCSLSVTSNIDKGIFFDLCSAPGGKSFTIAELMNNDSKIYSFDIHEHKIKLIQDGANRLGLSSIIPKLGDATEYNHDLEQADRVLCDVPCSGFGVFSKKPEIKYKDKKDYENLPDIQIKILENASRYVKENGVLFYSTCTVLKSENQNVVDKFLKNHPEFISFDLPDVLKDCFIDDSNSQALILPKHFDSDGFFIAGFRKRKLVE